MTSRGISIIGAFVIALSGLTLVVMCLSVFVLGLEQMTSSNGTSQLFGRFHAAAGGVGLLIGIGAIVCAGITRASGGMAFWPVVLGGVGVLGAAIAVLVFGATIPALVAAALALVGLLLVAVAWRSRRSESIDHGASAHRPR